MMPAMFRREIDLIASARHEPADVVRERFSDSELRKTPKRFSPNLWRVFNLDIDECRRDGDLVYLTLQNGSRFFGPPSTGNFLRQFDFVEDLVPKTLTAEGLRLAVDVAVRYNRNAFALPFEFDVLPGFTVMEAGAFQGLLTRWLADKVGNSGRVIAVEMMRDNVEIMRLNLPTPAYENVTIVEKGVWNRDGVLTAKSKGLQRSSLSSIDSVAGGDEHSVETVTLDAIVEANGLDHIDVVFITVNGSEVEALEGFRKHIDRVDKITIAAPYGNADRCKAFLASVGFSILAHQNPKQVSAVHSRIATAAS